jgi:hypothetical protein
MAAVDKNIEAVVSALTELRMRFNPDERQILDALVTGEAAEVSGHSFDPGAAVGRFELRFDEEAIAYKLIGE